MQGHGVKLLEGLDKKRMSFVGLLCQNSGSFVLGMVLQYCQAQICTGLCIFFDYQPSCLAVIATKALHEDVPIDGFLWSYIPSGLNVI